jgi:hypothetical protein
MPRPTGKGAGYGGPARGEGNRGAPGIGRPRADVAPVIAMAKAERIERLKEHLIGLALTAEREADQITATLGYLKHEDGPAQRVELSGANGGPMRIERVIIDPSADQDA